MTKILRKLLWSILVILLVGFVTSVISDDKTEKKISLNFVDIKVRDLLHVIAEVAHKNIIISNKVDGKLTIDLHDVSWREALNTVLQMQNLTPKETARVITILTQEELNKNEQLLLSQEVFNLRYVAADNISKILKPMGVLSSRGKSEAESATNSLIVADTADKLATVKRLLKQIDVPAKQVLIEARVVNADDSFLQELGLELNNTKKNQNQNESSQIVLEKNQFNFAITKFGNNVLDVELTALEEKGRGKVISRPRLVVADRQSASIETGTEIPYQEKTKEGDTSVAFKKAVLSLKVTPDVVAKDAINLALELSQDKVGRQLVNGVPTIDTRKIHTQVLVRTNETVILGGIYEWSNVTHVRRVPLLGEIPIINIFFSKKETKLERKELLVFVTPKILNSGCLY
jgi:type IV pilus assembly protein PilQ